MVILVGGDGGRRAVRVGALVALFLLVLGFVVGRYAQVEVLGATTTFAPPAAMLVATDDGDTVTLRTTPGARDIPAGEVPSGTVVGVEEDHGSWLRVHDLRRGTPGWVSSAEVRRGAQAFTASPSCPVPLHGRVDGGAFAMVGPGAQLELIDAHRAPDGTIWVGVRAEGVPGIGLVRSEHVAVSEPSSVAGTCLPVAVDPTTAGHRH